MLVLENKTILIISPQSWGKMFVSKHHYAIELAKKGNHVFFLNPPDAALKERVLISPAEGTAGLFIVSHRLNFPYNIKFHAIGIFHWLMKWQVKKILLAMGKPVDIVWSFDLGNLYPFKLFPKNAMRIFHPVDEPLNATAHASAKGAQVIFSVTQEILDKFRDLGVPSHFINHGVSESFFQNEKQVVKSNNKIRVGFSGNLLRPDIDRETLLKIIYGNEDILFDCWGSYSIKEANIGGELDGETSVFIETLKSIPNVCLHGAVNSEKLVMGYNEVDVFLICYDIKKDQSKGTNYHKIMEFLSTGKVIVSNNVTTYKGMPQVLSMLEEREDNRRLPLLFKDTIKSLDKHNAIGAMNFRKEYARANEYGKQIEKIEELL